MKKELLIPKKTIQSKVNELAREISSDYSGREPIIIGILNGVVFFFADLVRKMTVPSRIDFIRASKKKVRSVIKISDNVIEEIKRKTEAGDKYLPEFVIEIMDEDNNLVAKAEKVIYVKKK